MRRPWFKRFLAGLLLPLVIAGLSLVSAAPADAARGGRMGGGSFRAPSMPRSTGGTGYRSGGYRGGGGFGFPFIIPIFGFGGGGLFGILILMAVAGVLVNAFRGAGAAGGAALNGYGEPVAAMPSKVNMIQVQVGLLATAKQLQDDLRPQQQVCNACFKKRRLLSFVSPTSGSTPTQKAERFRSTLLSRPLIASR